ncbi:TPA_asm: non-structural polyprotein [Pycnopodia helianthoides associated picornavirus 1]|nr:TPA_asm: non-structural polyprotein [Pycnopodia helianthoides associated picornavirus 1]
MDTTPVHRTYASATPAADRIRPRDQMGACTWTLSQYFFNVCPTSTFMSLPFFTNAVFDQHLEIADMEAPDVADSMRHIRKNTSWKQRRRNWSEGRHREVDYLMIDPPPMTSADLELFEPVQERPPLALCTLADYLPIDVTPSPPADVAPQGHRLFQHAILDVHPSAPTTKMTPAASRPRRSVRGRPSPAPRTLADFMPTNFSTSTPKIPSAPAEKKKFTITERETSTPNFSRVHTVVAESLPTIARPSEFVRPKTFAKIQPESPTSTILSNSWDFVDDEEVELPLGKPFKTTPQAPQAATDRYVLLWRQQGSSNCHAPEIQEYTEAGNELVDLQFDTCEKTDDALIDMFIRLAARERLLGRRAETTGTIKEEFVALWKEKFEQNFESDVKFDAMHKKMTAQKRELTKLEAQLKRKQGKIQREVEKEKMRRQRNRKDRANDKFQGLSVFIPDSITSTVSDITTTVRNAASISETLNTQTLPAINDTANAVAGMYNSAQETSLNLNRVLTYDARRVSEAAQTFADTAEKFSANFDSVKSIFDTVESVVKSFTCPPNVNLIDACAAGYLLFKQLRDLSVIGVTSAAKLLATALGISIEGIYEIICNTFQHIKNLTTPVPAPESSRFQGGFDFVTSAIGDFMDNCSSAVSESGWISMTVVSILGTCGFMMSGSVPSFAKSSKWFADFGRMSQGVRSMRDFSMWIMDRVSEVYYESVLGMSPDQASVVREYPDLERAFSACQFIVNLPDAMVNRSEDVANQILTLWKILSDYKIKATKARDDKMCRLISEYQKLILHHQQVARTSPARICKVREEPISVFVASEGAGTGKTMACDLFQKEIFRKYMEPKGVKYENAVFTRKVANEYWDGYLPEDNGEHITYFDDFLQLADTSSRPNPEILEVISTKNTAPFQLHMSSVDDKKDCYFKSKYLMFSSNTLVPQPKSITSPDALHRRFDICVAVRVDSNYGVLMGGSHPCYRYDADVADAYRVANGVAPVGEGLATDFYLFDVYKMSGTEVKYIQRGMSYQMFIDYLFAKIDKHQEKAYRLKQQSLAFAGINLDERTIEDLDTATTLRELMGKFDEERLLQAVSQEAPIEWVKGKLDSLKKASGIKLVESKTSVISYFNQTSNWIIENLFGDSKVAQPHLVDAEVCDCEVFAPVCASVPAYDLPQPSREKFEGDWDFTPYVLAKVDSAKSAVSPACEESYALLKNLYFSGASVVRKTCEVLYTCFERASSLAKWIYRTCAKFFVIPRSVIEFGSSWMRIAVNSVVALGIVKFLQWGLSTPNTNVTNNCDFWVRFEGVPCVSECHCCNDLNLTAAWRQELVKLCHFMGTDGGFKFLSHNKVLGNRLFLWYMRNVQPESAQDITMKAPKEVRAESAQETTLKAPKEVRAESVESLTLKPKLPVMLEELQCFESCRLVESDKLYAPHDIVRVEQARAVMCRNTVHLIFSLRGFNAAGVPGTLRHTGVGTFVRGRIALTCRHVIPPNFETVKIFNPWQPITAEEIPRSACKISHLKDASGRETDAALIEFPANVPSRPDIVNKFVNADDLPRMGGGSLVLDGLRVVNGIPLMFTTRTPSFRIYTGELDMGDNVNLPRGMKFTRTLQYDLDTQVGDSGSMVTISNNNVASKIAGMHIGGFSGNKYAISLSRQFVQRSLFEHYEQYKTPISSRLDSQAPFSSESAIEMANLGLPASGVEILDMPSVVLPKKGMCIHFGRAPKPVQPVKSNVFPSAISGAFGEPTSRPAHLTPFRLNGELIEPHANASSKLLHPRPFIDPAKIKRACNEVSQHLGRAPKDSYYRKVLTIEEAVAALEIPELAAVKRSTSKGYPSVLRGRVTNKTELLGKDGDFVIDPELRRAVEEMISVCKQGKRPQAIWQAMLKDERRPHAKVNAGKTRQIYACWIVLLIVCRMYFGGMLAWTMKQRISNSIALGVNPYSLEWQQIADHMHEAGYELVSGDHENYDGENNAAVINGLLDIVEDQYSDNSVENTTVRAALWDTMAAADVIINGEVVRLTHSHPSGGFLTTWINCVSDLVYHCMIFNELCTVAGVKKRFLDHIRMICFGDDVMFAPDACCKEMFCFAKVRDAFRYMFDMNYTLEDKSTEDKGYRSIEEVEFLKRSFRKNHVGVYSAPLSLKSIHEMVNWVRGKENLKATGVNVSFAVRELFFHGEEVYDEHVAVLRESCAAAGVTVYFPTFKEWEENWDAENGFSPITSLDYSELSRVFGMPDFQTNIEFIPDAVIEMETDQSDWDSSVRFVQKRIVAQFRQVPGAILSDQTEHFRVTMAIFHYLSEIDKLAVGQYQELLSLHCAAERDFDWMIAFPLCGPPPPHEESRYESDIEFIPDDDVSPEPVDPILAVSLLVGVIVCVLLVW